MEGLDKVHENGQNQNQNDERLVAKWLNQVRRHLLARTIQGGGSITLHIHGGVPQRIEIKLFENLKD